MCSLGETDGEIIAALLELVPVADEPRRDDLVRFPGGFRTIGLGEVAALGDGGDVGSVVGEHGFEDVAGLGGIGPLGHDVDPVLLAASCRDSHPTTPQAPEASVPAPRAWPGASVTRPTETSERIRTLNFLCAHVAQR